MSRTQQDPLKTDGGDTTINDLIDAGDDVLDAYSDKIEAGERLPTDEMDTWLQANTLKGAQIALARSDLQPDEVADTLEVVADMVRNTAVES